MKTKFVFLMLLMTFVSSISFAQKEPKFQTALIQTNAQCSDCKQRLEGELNFEKGIVYAELKMENKQLEVRYRTKKTNLDQIRKAIAKIGYDADDVKADQKAQNKLPTCCQPGGHE